MLGDFQYLSPLNESLIEKRKKKEKKREKKKRKEPKSNDRSHGQSNEWKPSVKKGQTQKSSLKQSRNMG